MTSIPRQGETPSNLSEPSSLHRSTQPVGFSSYVAYIKGIILTVCLSVACNPDPVQIDAIVL